MERHACTAALVRPDHYVFGTAAEVHGIQRLLHEWQRRLPAAQAREVLTA
jgi:3-(3-hydroxy-phenyl)propionate hydroxylase